MCYDFMVKGEVDRIQCWLFFSGRKQNTAYAGALDRESCCTFLLISCTESMKPSLLFSNFVGTLYFGRNLFCKTFI